MFMGRQSNRPRCTTTTNLKNIFVRPAAPPVKSDLRWHRPPARAWFLEIKKPDQYLARRVTNPH
jgi:hypothetical protein